jgi:tRNA (Thr-GGU) A37 N-methylase
MLTLTPIGHVRSPFQSTSEIPKGLGAQHEAEGRLEILLWAFDRSGGFDLVFTPPADDRPHGVFATRSPRRPNPLGLTVVELLRRDGPVLHVRGIDMLDATPILDIKPYLSSVPQDQLRRGWLAAAEARKK